MGPNCSLVSKYLCKHWANHMWVNIVTLVVVFFFGLISLCLYTVIGEEETITGSYHWFPCSFRRILRSIYGMHFLWCMDYYIFLI
jgi:hypothetical protein